MKTNHTVARHLSLYLITNDPAIAEHAVGAGVDRIFVDLEIHGKRERQAGLDTPINAHTTGDIAAIRARLPQAYILGRINPLHAGSQAEIDAVLAAGANAIMLPMFRRAAEVRQIAALVNGRAAFIPLVETKEAVACFAEWADAPGLTEIYVGLNDLRLSLGLPSIFSVLLNGLLEDFVRQISAREIPFGFGGLGRLSAPQPVPAGLLLAEHVRLGSTSVILSRAFHMRSKTLAEFTAAVNAAEEVAAIRRAWLQLQSSAPQQLVRMNGELKDRIARLDSGRAVPPA
ncbi:aldolase/citrate lyase family protein [Oleiharenicola lentus]|uniref:aldolase/citrate lyase family protein n=1 Tax=Oleiharenicola lentus TaxID=2508720 RepID=UPI0013E8F5AD|nr:aldolase/citrate lyase family protein [Oleiharenicola lentus]